MEEKAFTRSSSPKSANAPPDIVAVRFAEEVQLPIEYGSETYRYDEASPWLRARAKLPSVQLKRIALSLEDAEGASGDSEPELLATLSCVSSFSPDPDTVTTREVQVGYPERQSPCCPSLPLTRIPHSLLVSPGPDPCATF